ncbi:MAG: hypothetical protein R3325_01540 [Thermoanaerobaculia bacterium]|nr:hypothetical protein [Thermoanaerobaculia bacterium]
MSCPDWNDLTAHRYAPDGREPAGWEAALAHLDSCGRCRRRALAADPTLLFRHAATSALPAGEVERIRVSVDALRRAGRLEAPERRSRRNRRRYGSVAAALVLAALALLAVGGRFDSPPSAPATPVAAPPADAASMRFGDRRVAPLDLATPPMVEAIDRPGARIYQLPQEDLSLVMIVDESLDV